MPRCYMVKKRVHEDSPSPCSPTEGSVAPLCYDEDSRFTDTGNEYAELETRPLSGRSQAETDAAHELLSLAHGVPSLPPPPPPPLTPAPQIQPPTPILPLLTYTIQPTNIYIVTDKPPRPIFPTFQSMPSCPCTYQTEPHLGYISYQQVPPDAVFGPRPQLKAPSDTDSETETHLVIASEPDSEQELEIESERECYPRQHFELEAEPSSESSVEPNSDSSECYQKFDGEPDIYLNYSTPESSPLSYSEAVLRPIYDRESVSTPPRYESSPIHNAEPDPTSFDTAAWRPHFYTESESSYVRFSEPDPGPLECSEAVPPSEPVIHEPIRNEPEGRPCEIAKEEVPAPAPPKCQKKKYYCTDCGKRYATSSNLSRHRQTHRSLDSIMAKRCGECGKVYVSMPALAMHVLTHRMNHACRLCGKQFSRPWLLRGHLRSHTGEKPYKCEACGKSFADRSNLRAHLQTHSAERNYTCEHCNKTFALKSYLNRHQETACAGPEIV